MDRRGAGSGARTRVAVLGGGVGGITAAFELTATPELRERFDVTIYQLGWRIGGKGGGKPTMAQAGGKEPTKLPEALQIARETIREMLQS